jgi:hypothetical protein
MKLPALREISWNHVSLILLALLTTMIIDVQGTMDIQQARGMEALVAREFEVLENRQATNLQVGSLNLP